MKKDKTMRTKNIITRYAAAFAAAALVLAGCQVETAKKTGQNPGSEELRFEVAAPHPDSGSDDTRALKTGWAEEDRIVAFFDHDISKYIVLEYNVTDEKWVAENRSETLPAEGTNGSIQALHAGNGPGFAFDGDHIVGVFGDLLHTEEGTYTVDGDTVYLTLVMKRGMTTAIKMEGAGINGDNMNWRLSGPGIHVSNGEGTIPAENLLYGGEPAQIKFLNQLTTSFVASDPLVAGAPDPMLTNEGMAVFHVFAQPHSAPGTTTLNIYNIDEPSVIYTRTYDKELTAGATILLAGPASVDEADEWETVPPATDEPVEFRYNFVTGFNGDIYGEGTSQFLVMLTTYDPFGLNREGYQANIDFCTTAVSAPWTTRYIDMPAGEYTFSATPATGTFTADDTSLKKYNAGGEVIENPTLTGGVVTVAIEGGVYTIDFNFDLDGGETFSGVYTGPLLFENPDYVLLADTFSADDPDGEGTIYYKRINLADPADKTVMVTNSAYNTTSANASYSGSVTVPATVTYEGVEYIVKEIGAYAFAGCTSLTSVIMADGITKIGDYAQRCGVAMCMHMAETPVAALACVQAAAATENFMALEFHSQRIVDRWSSLVTGLSVPLIKDGYIDVPYGPGLGFDGLNEELIRELDPKHPKNIWQDTDPWDDWFSHDRLWS